MAAKADELSNRLRNLKVPIEADASVLADLADKAAKAGKAVADMQQQIADATKQHASSQADIKQSIADNAIDQEQKVKDLTLRLADEKASYTKDLANGTAADQLVKSQQSINTLQLQLTQEQAALSAFYAQNTDLVAQLTEAKRRASETEFERRVEDLKKQAAQENAQYLQTVSRLNAQLAALLKEKADALKAEQDYTASLAKENAKRLADYQATLTQARSFLGGGTFGPFPQVSFSASGGSTIGNFSENKRCRYFAAG